MPWTSDDLIDSVRRRAQLPDASADGAISDADILELANEEIALRLVPLVRSAREDYFVTYKDTSIASGTASYRIPERAQASALRDVTIVTANGDEYSIPRISLEDAGDMERMSARTCFVMEGPNIRLIPTPTTSTDTLRIRYHRSHSRLVTTTGSVARTVFRYLSDSGPTITTTAVPTEWDDALAGGVPDGIEPLRVDLIRATPPFGPYVDDLVITAIADDTPSAGLAQITFQTEPSSTIWLADVLGYLSTAGTTPVINLPRECWPLLISAVTSRVLEVIGDRDAAQMAFALYEREQGNVIQLLTPRVEGARKRVIDQFSTWRRGGRR